MSVARGASALGRLALSRSVRLSVAAFGTALLVALAGGCTSNAEPSPLPKPTASASPSPSATPSPPELPAEAEGTSPKAAKAFARHYFDLINYAMSTGDTGELRVLSADSCRACNAITDGIRKAYAGGGHLEGRGWLVRDLQYLRLEADRALVSASVEISRQAAYRAESSTPTWSEGTRGHVDLRLSWHTGRWIVYELVANQ